MRKEHKKDNNDGDKKKIIEARRGTWSSEDTSMKVKTPDPDWKNMYLTKGLWAESI